jgi:hypothetical protein
MDDLDFLTSDFFCSETKNYFLHLKRKLELEEEYQFFLQQRREKLVAQAIELGLIEDQLEADFLATETIEEMSRDYRFYFNPAE